VIVDSSAIVAIVRDEPEARQFATALADAERPRMSAANWFEAAMVAEARAGRLGSDRFDEVIALAGIEVVAVTPALAFRAREAWRSYGRGNHPAQLNFGDCFAYALAKDRDEPLLFKGADFARTDVKAAL